MTMMNNMQEKILRTTALAQVIIFGMVLISSAEPKKDVSDPVLQEILSSYETRMPRFIEKFGKDVFVADQPVTRSSFMQAIYEYDKSLKSQKKEYITRQEFEEFYSKLSLGEKNVSKPVAALDIMQVINDLTPNMPYILDNSLNESKVFQNLKKEVMGRTGADTAAAPETRNVLEQTRTEIAGIQKRLEKIEKSGTTGKTSVGETSNREELVQITKKLALIEKRIDQTESRLPASSQLQATLDGVRTNLGTLTQRIDRIEKTPGENREMKTSTGETVKKTELAAMYEKLASIERKLAVAENRSSANQGVQGAVEGVRANLEDLVLRMNRLEKTSDQSKAPRITESDVATKAELIAVSDKLALIEKKIAFGGNGSGTGDKMQNAVEGMRSNLGELARRVERLEKTPTERPRIDSSAAVSAAAPKNMVTRQEIAEISGKLASLEREVSQNASVDKVDGMKNNIEQTRRSLARIEKRMDEIERNSPGTVSYEGEARAYAPSALTKISLGLSMVAALFIAR